MILSGNIRRLTPFCLMLFLQYMLVSVWWVPYAAYLTNAGVEADMKALALSAMAIGFMASSIMGVLADRYFSAQRVLATGNFTVAILLACAGLTDNIHIVIALVFIIMLLYMPTWALTGSIVFKHVQQEQFPRVRLFGTLGWVTSGLFSLIFVNAFNVTPFDGSSVPFLCGSGIAFVTAIFNLTLPDTPPSMEKERFSIVNIMGFKVFTLFRDRNFLVFFLCTFTAVLGYALYYTYASMFFYDRNFRYITVTMNWGQVGELLFLFITTLVIIRFGFKKTMIIGLGAMVLRYASFWWGSVTDMPAFYIIGVLFHGIIFGLFFVTGQIYVDKKAPEYLRAQAQGLMAFLIWGIALFVGNYLCSKLIFVNTTYNNVGNAIYNWPVIFGTVTVFSAFVWILFIVFYRKEENC